MEYVDSFKLFEAKLNEETLSDGEFAIVAIKKKYKYKQRYQKAVAWEPGTEMLASLGDGPFPDEISVRSVRGGGFGVDNEEFYKFWSVVKKISETEFWKLAKTLPDMFDDDNAVIPSGFKINESEILEAKYNSAKNADDVFFLWDETVDDDREGIEHGNEVQGKSHYSNFHFTGKPQGIDKFKSEFKKLAKKNNWEYDLDDNNLWVYESKVNEAKISDKSLAQNHREFHQEVTFNSLNDKEWHALEKADDKELIAKLDTADDLDDLSLEELKYLTNLVISTVKTGVFNTLSDREIKNYERMLGIKLQ